MNKRFVFINHSDSNVKSLSLRITTEKIPVIKITPQDKSDTSSIAKAVSQKLQEAIKKSHNIEYSVADLENLIEIAKKENKISQFEVKHGDSIVVKDKECLENVQFSRLSAILYAKLTIDQDDEVVFRDEVHVPIATLHGLLPMSNEQFIHEMQRHGNTESHNEMICGQLIAKGKRKFCECVSVLLAATENPQKAAEALSHVEARTSVKFNDCIITSILINEGSGIVGKAGLIGIPLNDKKHYKIITISEAARRAHLKQQTFKGK